MEEALNAAGREGYELAVGQSFYCPVPGTKLGFRKPEDHTAPVSMELSECLPGSS